MSVAFVFQCVGNVSLGLCHRLFRLADLVLLQIVGPQVYLAREAPKYYTGQCQV
jgi:hypothetical protein